MWLRRLLLFVFALLACAAAVWFFIQSGDGRLHAVNVADYISSEVVAVTYFDDPVSVADQLRNQPTLSEVHPAAPWLLPLTKRAGSYPEWYFEHGGYWIPGDTTFFVFGIPQTWSRQQAESWFAAELGAQPVQSGLLAFQDDGLFLHVNNELAVLTDRKLPAGTLDRRFVLPESEQPAAITAVLHRRGDASFNQASVSGEVSLPFNMKLKCGASIRDVYLRNQSLTIEEHIELKSTPFNGALLPSDWSQWMPTTTRSFSGLAAASGYELIDRRLANESDSTTAGYKGRLAELETAANLSAEVLLEDWWVQGAAHFIAGDRNYLICGSSSSDIALGSLLNYGTPKETRLSSGVVLSWENPELLQHLMRSLISFNPRAAWVHDRVVVFAASEDHLIRLVSQLATEQTLPEDHLLVNALHRGESFIRYERTGAGQTPFFSELSLPAFSGGDEEQHLLHSGMLTRKGNLVTRLDAQTSPTPVTTIHLEWEGTVPGLRPETLSSARDHRNNSYYLLIQDNENTLHALNASGRTMWSITLDGPIRGTIEAIDLYRNGKIQVICATERSVYAFAVNGKNVDGFPIRMPQNVSITSDLFVADYDRNRNYRFLFGTSDGKLRNYRLEGEVTPGWRFVERSSPVTQVKHIKAGNRDYIFTLYADGEIDLLKRNGELRYRTDLKLPEISSEVLFRMTDDIANSSILVRDSAGFLLEAPFAAKAADATTAIGRADAIALADINNDRLADLIVVDSTEIKGFAADNSLLFEREFLAPVSADVKTYAFSEGEKIGVVIPEIDELHLLEADGSTSDGYPLFGASRFVIRDLDADGKLELITTDGKGLLLCYEL
jgi:hypothetical protein